MEENDIEIIEENKSNDKVISEPEVIDTKENKKKSFFKKEKKEKITSNVYENSNVEIVETAVEKGTIGSLVIGEIDGDNAVSNNKDLPNQIDITVKKKVDNKNNIKKVKVVTKKEKIISTIVSIFVILVIGAAGYAIYYFGYETNPYFYDVKNIYLELGEELPTSVSYYITSPRPIDDMEYQLDLSNVEKDVVGTYQYSVSHQSVTKYGQIVVNDTTAPTVTFKEDLVFLTNSFVDKSDLVASCEDISNCNYRLEYEISTETPGEKTINVYARDDQGNESVNPVTITILDIKKTLVCTSKETISEDKTYQISHEDTLSFDSNDYLVKKVGAKKYTYLDYSAYFALFNEQKDNEDYLFDKSSFSYSIKDNALDYDVTSFNDVMKYYTDLSYTCKEK